eukprot:TRINITY_DN24326_c0_g2_i2.p1 TRINITY_DN24326_c0_g2~~TRINITY_DN24326_c0_g2_i2.p1  ORF type:complete len:158 (-),score=39.13 TRINITY_DN24326_c0_g2_i2:86-508(-)
MQPGGSTVLFSIGTLDNTNTHLQKYMIMAVRMHENKVGGKFVKSADYIIGTASHQVAVDPGGIVVGVGISIIGGIITAFGAPYIGLPLMGIGATTTIGSTGGGNYSQTTLEALFVQDLLSRGYATIIENQEQKNLYLSFP